jgi:hypothetical protein
MSAPLRQFAKDCRLRARERITSLKREGRV